jgi:hypothetical protein
MSDWSWITFGYVVVYGGIVAYATFLAARYRRAQRRLDGLD